jgi:hypothetical protein
LGRYFSQCFGSSKTEKETGDQGVGVMDIKYCYYVVYQWQTEGRTGQSYRYIYCSRKLSGKPDIEKVIGFLKDGNFPNDKDAVVILVNWKLLGKKHLPNTGLKIMIG